MKTKYIVTAQLRSANTIAATVSLKLCACSLSYCAPAASDAPCRYALYIARKWRLSRTPAARASAMDFLNIGCLSTFSLHIRQICYDYILAYTECVFKSQILVLTKFKHQHASGHKREPHIFVPAERHLLAAHEPERVYKRGDKELRYEYY